MSDTLVQCFIVEPQISERKNANKITYYLQIMSTLIWPAMYVGAHLPIVSTSIWPCLTAPRMGLGDSQHK
jgi:hypothetical protein